MYQKLRTRRQHEEEESAKFKTQNRFDIFK